MENNEKNRLTGVSLFESVFFAFLLSGCGVFASLFAVGREEIFYVGAF